MKTPNRSCIEDRLNCILEDAELLELSDRLVIMNGDSVILDVSTSTPPAEIAAQVQWPVNGTPVKVLDPVSTSLYMPKSVQEWLSKEGNGKTSNGLRKLIETVNPELASQAWLR